MEKLNTEKSKIIDDFLTETNYIAKFIKQGEIDPYITSILSLLEKHEEIVKKKTVKAILSGLKGN